MTNSTIERTATAETTALPAPNAAQFKIQGWDFLAGRIAGIQEDGRHTNALGLDLDTIHRHIASEWKAKCLSVCDFAANLAADAARREDVSLPLSAVIVTPELTILEQDTKLSPLAIDHLLTKTYEKDEVDESDSMDFGGASSRSRLNGEGANALLAAGQGAALAATLNYGLAERLAGGGKVPGVLLRNRKEDDGTSTTRAVLSGRYGIINNDDIIQILIDSFPEHSRADILASHITYNGNDMVLNLFCPDNAKHRPDSDYGFGVSVKNSEVGNHTLRVSAFLYRAVCRNGCIWDRAESEIRLNKKHLGAIDMDGLRFRIKQIVELGLSEGRLLLTQFDYAKEIEVPSIEQTIAVLSKRNRITIPQGRNWLATHKADNYDGTVFGLINGLTAAAKEYKGETRAILESTAAKLLTADLNADLDVMKARWGSIFGNVETAWQDEPKALTQYLKIC